jgi:hypothetical protein
MSDCALRIAENATLLRRTCDKPIDPTCNPLPPELGDSGRTLKFHDELDIVSCLSYLSTYSDDPGMVMALCVEEKVDHQGIIVSISTNNETVSDLERGVQSIVDVLERQAKGSSFI